MRKFVAMLGTLFGNCPQGGDHTRGTSGEWAGRCTKCGQPC
jgi:hypothetical protein